MKFVALSSLLLASCATPPSSPSDTSPSNREREDMERKLIGFQQKFDRFDDNGDGYISRSELSAGLIAEEIDGVTTAQIPRIFSLYDRNHDNRISLAEVNTVYEAGPDAALRLQKAP